MAVVENIREQKQTPSAQRGVIDYCCRADKTHLDEKTVFVSGVNCVQEMANDSFLATQNLFCHKTGARFYHYVQSFTPEENITPKQVHEIGLELAKVFGEREVLVATHIDRDHLHKLFYKGLSVYGTKPTIKSRLSRLQEEYSGKRKAERKNLWNDL